MGTKTARLSTIIWQRLSIVKVEHNIKTISEAIEIILNVYDKHKETK